MRKYLSDVKPNNTIEALRIPGSNRDLCCLSWTKMICFCIRPKMDYRVSIVLKFTLLIWFIIWCIPKGNIHFKWKY